MSVSTRNIIGCQVENHKSLPLWSAPREREKGMYSFLTKGKEKETPLGALRLTAHTAAGTAVAILPSQYLLQIVEI